MKLPKDVLHMTGQDWADYGAPRRRAMPATWTSARVHAPKLTNKPSPEHLTPGPAMGDEYYAARARVRAAEDSWRRAVANDAFWSAPDDA